MITTIIAAGPTQSAKGEVAPDAGLWLDSATLSRITMAKRRRPRGLEKLVRTASS